MADAQEDWLMIVSDRRDYGCEDLHGRTCGPLGGARWKKTSRKRERRCEMSLGGVCK
jgi:hypothetical protein